MKSLLLTFLLLGLVAVLKAQEVPLDDQDVSGIWYTKAIMHNDSLPEDKMPMKAFPMKVIALEEGNLETKITFWRKGHCHDFKILMNKTEEPGKYTACNGRKTVYIEELPVKDHYIFYCEGRHHGKYFSIGKLVGRDPKENPEAMEEFKKFTQRKGLREENIFVPEMSGLPGPCFRSWLWEGLSCRCDGGPLTGPFSLLGFFWFLQISVCLEMTRVCTSHGLGVEVVVQLYGSNSLSSYTSLLGIESSGQAVHGKCVSHSQTALLVPIARFLR
ncbi:odorant-binding protein 2a-like [Onychomys torridus]|uniref:odorant-binding protein 2a-like n=1 Tax=Onychomys torridus TaxID=38674 RepID=UPI00167FAA0E|nr:odorant-binding protein 2a-like [Onychomys torridus]